MFNGRTPHVWKATVAGDNGQVLERRQVVAQWSPEKVTLDEIVAVAAIEATFEAQKQVRFQPVAGSAELVS